MMDQDIKQKWVEALRSGKYEQGENLLRYKNTYCCLGVLCDLYSQDWSNAELQDVYSFGGEIEVLPDNVKNWARLDYPNPPTSRGNLAYLNDRGVTFEKLADLIEKEL